MSINILMPALSPTMTEGNLVKWHKNEGDAIKSGDLLAEIETDKATMEVEAVDSGILGKIFVPEGSEDVAVNTVIAVLLEKGESAADINVEVSKKDLTSPSENLVVKDCKVDQKNDQAATVKGNQNTNTSYTKDIINIDSSVSESNDKPQNHGRVIASPLAKRVAAQNQIDLSNLQGTGPRGRIIHADVIDHLNNPRSNSTVTFKPDAVYGDPTFKSIKLSNVRKIIAKRLTESKQNIPHFYLNVDCQMDALLKAREEINVNLSKDEKISVNDFVIKAMAHAMNDVPEANASWGDDHIKMYDRIDIAVAVAIEGGLITPVLFDAFNKPLSYIASEMKSLAARARDNKLKPHEFQGGTISLSNLGMYGVKSFSAIVNPPQACIMAVGRAIPQPIVDNGQIKIGTIMSCTLSVDHRVVDGAVGARYLKAFQSYIESPIKLFYR